MDFVDFQNFFQDVIISEGLDLIGNWHLFDHVGFVISDLQCSEGCFLICFGSFSFLLDSAENETAMPILQLSFKRMHEVGLVICQ